MNTGLLKFYSTLSLIILLLTGAWAQRGNFVYIQAEDQKPFYVKIDKKYLSSSATGYMIIPRLNAGQYNLILGSQKNNWAEQQFNVIINNDDRGFLLKSAGNTNMLLLDLKNEQLLKSSLVEVAADTYEYTERTDDFAKTLAAVVNDPSIARVRVEKKEADSTTAKPAAVIAEVNVSKSVVNQIIKLDADSAAEGVNIRYVDKVNSNTDTVNVLIPLTMQLSKQTPVVENLVPKPAVRNTVKSNADSRFIDMELQNPNAKPDSTNAGDFVITERKQRLAELNSTKGDTSSKTVNAPLKMINSDCKSIATQSGFTNLRKKMVAASNEEGMTKIAIKAFTNTCFTTEQIKNLGGIYLKEEERYKFYVAAYPHVSDSYNFSSLEDQLTDNYYQSRFKAMVSR